MRRHAGCPAHAKHVQDGSRKDMHASMAPGLAYAQPGATARRLRRSSGLAGTGQSKNTTAPCGRVVTPGYSTIAHLAGEEEGEF